MVSEGLSNFRAKLDSMSEKIMVRFGERSSYKLNESVYQRNPLEEIDGKVMSFFQLSLKGIQKYHGSLGRYKYPDQHPLAIEGKSLHSKVKREVIMERLPKFKINLEYKIIPQYQVFLREICEPGEDPSTYGETVFCDADLIMFINERINQGRYVAAAKLKSDPSLSSIIDDRVKLKDKVTDIPRERDVVKNCRELAEKYKLRPDFGEDFAMWMIQTTIGVEIDYIQKFVKRFGEKAPQKYKEIDNMEKQRLV